MDDSGEWSFGICLMTRDHQKQKKEEEERQKEMKENHANKQTSQRER